MKIRIIAGIMCVVAVFGLRSNVALPGESKLEKEFDLPVLQPLPVKLEPFDLPESNVSESHAARVFIAANTSSR